MPIGEPRNHTRPPPPVGTLSHRILRRPGVTLLKAVEDFLQSASGWVWGVPLVALVWDALNRLVAGEIHRVLLPAGLAALALLLVLLRILARTLSRWDHLPQERDDADDA